MDKEKETLELTPEEQKAEEAAMADVKSEEIREKIAEDLGIDPDEESDLLEKLTERELNHRKQLSTAIRQKRDWRSKAQKPNGSSKETPKDEKKSYTEEDLDKLVEKKLADKLSARDLESLDVSDELKTEIKEMADAKGISVKEAANLPYIRFRIKEEETKARIESATPKRSKKGGYQSTYDPSQPLNPQNYDYSTKEGRASWEADKKARRQWEKANK